MADETFEADVQKSRAAIRVEHILKASEKLSKELQNPDCPEARKVKLLARLNEYRIALENFKKYGQETPPADRLEGVNVEVPTYLYEITGHAPGGAE